VEANIDAEIPDLERRIGVHQAKKRGKRDEERNQH
jgi:hypothetical protein